jgi:hypothetical protein
VAVVGWGGALVVVTGCESGEGKVNVEAAVVVVVVEWGQCVWR